MKKKKKTKEPLLPEVKRIIKWFVFAMIIVIIIGTTLSIFSWYNII